jgi:hypothetical protein
MFTVRPKDSKPGGHQADQDKLGAMAAGVGEHAIQTMPAVGLGGAGYGGAYCCK